MAETANPPTDQPWKRYPILVVDDEPSVVEELKTLFRLEGFNVATALSGEQGLERLRELPARLVISDQKMVGGISGTEFLARVKAAHPETLTMMLSAFSEPEFLMDAVNRANVFQYLLKPWNQEDLLNRVGVALQLVHAREEQARLARANARLLEKMSRMESFSLFGDFSTALYDRFFPVLRVGLMNDWPKPGARDGSPALFGDREAWSHLATVVSRLGQVTTFFQLPSGFRPGSLETVVKGCVEEARRHGDIDVEWSESYQEGLPPLLIQARTLGVAVKALIENAVLFSRPRPGRGPARVSVRLYREEGAEPSVNAEFTDSGPGAGGERIFSPLYTSCEQATAPWIQNRGLEHYNFEPYNHVGLGLAIARWCVTEHDGVVELLNPGEPGARFRISIPIAQQDLRRGLGIASSAGGTAER